MTHLAKRIFYYAFFITLLVKAIVAWQFPFTGDEAFFYQWGIYPALGYSDHPPMVGWMLAGLKLLGENPFTLRLITVLMSNVIALLMLDSLLKTLPTNKNSLAWLGAAIYLVLPWSWMPILVTTDTPLIYFMAFSCWAYLRADNKQEVSYKWYALAGLFLGLAFLSKYFSALLGIAYAIHILIKKPNRWFALSVLLMCVLPAVGLHFYFNAYHGWTNIMFNFFNRNEDSTWSLLTPLIYLGMMVYLLTPWLLAHGLKSFRDRMSSTSTYISLTFIAFAPLALLLVLSFRRTIGLHWVLGFIPFFVMWVSYASSEAQLLRGFKWTMAFCLPHAVIVAALLWAPLSVFQSSKWFEKVVFVRHTDQIISKSRPAADAIFMATAYSPASVLAYHYGQYMPVFGMGKYHARQDDQLVDFKKFEGKNIRIFDGTIKPQLEQFATYFDSVNLGSIEVKGVTYYFVDGVNFKYATYRNQILQTIANRYHNIPKWLPNLGNPFCERYGFAECSPQAKL